MALVSKENVYVNPDGEEITALLNYAKMTVMEMENAQMGPVNVNSDLKVKTVQKLSALIIAQLMENV